MQSLLVSKGGFRLGVTEEYVEKAFWSMQAVWSDRKSKRNHFWSLRQIYCFSFINIFNKYSA
ncbi:MAG: hypothetical protein K0S80_4992 [Neobacillus sp.]|nr:hypothetical protein [Neobacillus sp.]